MGVTVSSVSWLQPFQKQAEIDIRSCCLTEIKQTEEKYTETLESIEKVAACGGAPGGGLWQHQHPRDTSLSGQAET